MGWRVTGVGGGRAPVAQRLGGKIKPRGFRGQKLKADEAEVKRTRVEGRLEEGEVGRTPGPQQGICI